MLTNQELKAAWDEGNSDGMGYAVGQAEHTPAEAAEFDGMTGIEVIDPEHNVTAIDSLDQRVVICDAHGPWAVTVA